MESLEVESSETGGVGLEAEAPSLTIEQQDALLGRLMRERKETELRKVALEAEAARIGENLTKLGLSVQRRLSGIQLQGEQLEPDFSNSVVWIEPSELDANKIVQLANDYREAVKKLKQISTQLAQDGWL